MISNFVKLAAVAVFIGNAAFAGQPKPVVLEPITHAKASLVIVDTEQNEITYTPAELEKFETFTLTTTTPWRDEPTEFEGVLLSDILAAHGLDEASNILVTAENDYSTTFSRELLENVQILVATRVDGKAHNRRNRGPIQFVIDAETYTNSTLTSESNFVWMAARIEVGK